MLSKEIIENAFHNKKITITEESININNTEFEISGNVIRFHKENDYNESFSIQWNTYHNNQYDDINNNNMSQLRINETGWKLDDLEGKFILEAGCGPGRFTRIFSQAKAKVLAFDFSQAVDANFKNNKNAQNIVFCQADIFNMPFSEGQFDYVYCHGVLQHTPNPQKAFFCLAGMVKPGGHLSVDIYRKDGLIRPWKSKYIWRPITTRVPPTKLLKFLQWFIPLWLPIDTFLKKIPYAGNYLGSIIPCWNYWNRPLSADQKVQWAVMDTFDALAPKYDIPASIEELESWFKEIGFTNIDVHPGGNGVVGNGTKPEHNSHQDGK
ncbi:MAG: class I SAM-dependent methyltransferase [Pseudomonadota bacterium]|nr:class I SAM-dependent methyltransferase [Pseudomonadota bacterium]